ncbi:MAG: hypothetical protein JWO38_1720 [Gemmataceae bacterium]|nr:hypothetical protein [Gemmataceae bacterium]
MSSRERTLAVLLIGLILLGVGGVGGYMLVYEPVQRKWAEAAKLEEEVADLDGKLAQAGKDVPRLADARRRSLPPDQTLSRREYGEMMSRLLLRANVPLGFRVTERSPDAAGVPLLAAKKPAYTRVVYEIAFEKADMWAVHDFLAAYYKLNLLHQITALEIKTDTAQTGTQRKAAPDRKDLSVKVTTEAIVLDGAEPRRTLLPVPTAFAAAGGFAGYHALALTPEAGRGLTPVQLAPVLSPARRDSTLIVQNDIFHGPLPPPPPLQVEKIADVSVEVEKPIPSVIVPLAGDLGPAGKVTLEATTDGKLFPPGGVKVDQAARTISLTPARGETGTATVTVSARAEGGVEAKAKFKVSVNPPQEAANRPDISDAIRLVIATTRSDGTAVAVIRDNFNPHTYEIEAGPDGVKVMKYWFPTAKKKPDPDYKISPKPVLIISDDTSATGRTFRVVAIDGDGIVVADLKGDGAKGGPKSDPGKAPGPRDRTGQGPAELLALVTGSAAVVARPAPPDQPTLYRWVVGKSLKSLTEVPKDEARRILRRSAETGPVGATAVAAGN